ncbi:hypothetical protein CHRY9293_02342 [Chryseobacterium potabilaquae]|uniref:Uncharacterized protein n=1 Tax=Chryseobacterium potabilaquae TaxID=2675057 RepID=A0A6N4X965_9FLAO|nr:hypothetical protein CHRY9293_02342 [Chryseobacterium potabilaquae]
MEVLVLNLTSNKLKYRFLYKKNVFLPLKNFLVKNDKNYTTRQ